MSELGFWRLAAAEPDRTVLVTPEGAEVSAGSLLARVNQVSNGLRALGLERGDTIAVVLPNGLPMLEVYLAALQIGLYFTPINHHLVGPEIAYILSDSEARAFVTDERFAEVATAAAEEIDLPSEARFMAGSATSAFRPYAELTEDQPTDAPADRTAGQPMHYTSGTTGRPKGVKRALADLDPDDMGALFAMFLTLFGIEERGGNVHLTCLPLYHTAVLMWTGCSLHLGHQVVLMDKWTPVGMLERIERYGVTTTHMVPTQFHRLLALPEGERASSDVSSLRHVVHGAAPCPPEIKRQMIDWWGPCVTEYYAATEGGGTIAPAEVWLERPGTVGQPWPGAEVRILDEDGNDVPTGEVGTVYMALAQVSFEYKGDAAKTAENRREGFFTVGDVGLLDEDGYLYLRDRKSDMIISGGVNIYPAEIEGVLLTNPKVGDAAVFGVPNPDWGEEIKAVIEPAAGTEPSDELAAELLEFCAGRLARFKAPRSIDFIVEMPRDPSGKLFKRRLRDPLLARSGSGHLMAAGDDGPRTRSWWGWGWSDQAVPEAAVGKLARSLSERFGVALQARPAPRIEDVQLPAARVEPPAALAGICSSSTLDRAGHAYGKAYRDVVRGSYGHYPSSARRGRQAVVGAGDQPGLRLVRRGRSGLRALRRRVLGGGRRRVPG